MWGLSRWGVPRRSRQGLSPIRSLATARTATLPGREPAAAAIRPDRGGPPPLGGALERRSGRGDGRCHLDHARPPDPDGPAERPARAVRADLPALRGADAAEPLAAWGTAAGQD